MVSCSHSLALAAKQNFAGCLRSLRKTETGSLLLLCKQIEEDEQNKP